MKLLALLLCLLFAQHVHASYLPAYFHDFESLLLRRMNFNADPCDDFYNYVCGNFNDSDVLALESERILETGLYEMFKTKRHELVLGSSAIRKAVRYYGSCVKELDDADSTIYIREKIHTFSDVFDIPHDFFIQGDSNLRIDRQKWTKILKYVHDQFGVEPFFDTDITLNENVRTNSPPESRGYVDMSSAQLAFEDEPHMYSCENRENVFHEHYKTAIQNIIDILRLTVTTDDVENIARSMIEIEFRQKGINCDQTDEVVETKSSEETSNATDFYALSELREQNWPVDLADYIKSIIETGAGNIEVDYDKLSVKVDNNHMEDLTNFFDEILNVDLLKYVYFRAMHQIITKFDTTCTDIMSNLPALKTRIYTEFRYPKIWERESVMHLTRTMIASIKYELQNMIASLPWVREDKTTFDALNAKFNKMKAKVMIELNLLNNTWIDGYYSQLKFDPKDTFLEMHAKVIKFNMYLKVTHLLSTAKPYVDDSASYSNYVNTFYVPTTDFETPFFNMKFPLSYNMGLLGSTIGHEITHAFDTDGVDYDETGAYNPMLSESAKQSMKEMADCVINYYDKLDVVIDKNNVTHVNGSTTVAENVADIGGVDAAYRAFKTMERSFGHDKQLRHPQLRRLTHDQLFFIGFTNYFCEKRDLARDYEIIKTDPHTPNLPRVRGTLANLPAFAKAYQCPAGSAYAPLEPCKVWTV